MEQAIWVAFGAIAALVMLGIVINVVYNQTSGFSLDDYDYVLDIMKNQCEFVCSLPTDTQLSQEIDMFSGGSLKALDNKICLYYEEEVSCRVCSCEMENEDGGDILLDLTFDLAQETFREHKYDCSFRKTAPDVLIVACRG